MYQVYILQSLANPEKSYVGLTTRDTNERLGEHDAGKSAYTKTYKPWKLIYFENFYCQLCAEKREQFLKSGLGYRFRKIMLNNYSALQKGR